MSTTKNSKMVSKILLVLSIQAVILVSVAWARPRIIPADHSKLDAWLVRNMRNYLDESRNYKYELDPNLKEAEANSRVVKVKKDGTGDFKTVTDAVNSIPSGNTQRVVVWIGGGSYNEKIVVDRSKAFVTFYGDDNYMPTITYNGTAVQYGTWNSATVAVESDYFVAVNINFVNSSPRPDSSRQDGQAVAVRISGDKAAFHNCRFIGFQDTLCDDKGRHFFRDCYIQGTVDFIFGNGKTLYLNTSIVSVAEGMGAITAQARNAVSEDSGFAFVHCNVTGTGDTYLGRAWKEMPRVVFAYTFMGNLINPDAWSNKMYQDHNRSVYYGEYKSYGPGASKKRPKYVKLLTDTQAQPFLSMTYIQGNRWILPPQMLNTFTSTGLLEFAQTAIPLT